MAFTNYYWDPDLSTGTESGDDWTNAWHGTLSAALTAFDAKGGSRRLNCKNPASTYNEGSALTYATSAAAGTYIEIRGCGSTDIDDGVHFDWGTQTITLSGDNLRLNCFDISTAAAGNSLTVTSSRGLIYDCKIENTAAGGEALSLTDGATAFKCYIVANGATASYAAKIEDDGGLIGCQIEGGGTDVVYIDCNGTSAQAVMNCLIIGDSGAVGIHCDGVNLSSGMVVKNNTIVDVTDGIQIDLMESMGSTFFQVFKNNLLYGSGSGTAINHQSASPTYGCTVVAGNAWDNFTSGSANIDADMWTLYENIELTGDPFTSKAGGDYSLNNTAGAGASCRGAAIQVPSTTDLFASMGYLDIGAVQTSS